MNTFFNNVWVFLIMVSLICYAIHHIFFRFVEFKGYDPSDRIRYAVGVIVFLIVFATAYFYEDANEIKDGEKYYVNLFEKKDAQKNYRVPGLLYKDEDGISLYEVYWSNGGTTTFENSYYIDLRVGEKVEMKDDNDRTWFVELTKETAE